MATAAKEAEQEPKVEEKKDEKKDDGSKDKTDGSKDKPSADGKEGDEKKKSAISMKEGAILSVDPETGYFNPGGGTSDHMLVNTSDKRLAIKIRSSNNALYRVHPVTMFIDPGQCQHMVVTRLPGPARADKLVVQYMFCTAYDLDAKEFYAKLAKDAKPDTVRVNLRMKTEKKLKYTSLEVVE